MMKNKLWYFFVIVYLLVDYGRPQDILGIGALRLGVLEVFILSGFLVFSGNLGKANSKQAVMIWLFIIILAIHVPFARNTYYAYGTTKGALLRMPFILSLAVCIDSISRLKSILSVCICLMIYVSVYSLFNKGMGSGNYFIDENDMALFINMWIPFCWYLFIYEKERLKRVFYATGIVIGVMAVCWSFSRGGLVGLLCMGFCLVVYSARKIRSVVLVCLIVVIGFGYAGKAYRKEASTIINVKEETAHARILLWKAAWDMFIDNPLGVGGQNFQVRVHEYQSKEFTRSMWGKVAHSLWFTLISELGVFGIIIYFFLLRVNFRDILFLKKVETENNPNLEYLHYLSLAFISSFAGYFGSGTFLSVLYYPHYWYATGLIVAATRIKNEILVHDENGKEILGWKEKAD